MAHLLRELSEGECTLDERPEGIVRTMLGASVTVGYGTRAGRLWLHETEQRFADGRVRVRDHLRFSVGEKLGVGEDPFSGAVRALSEELALPALPLIPWYVETKVIDDDYPGLPTHCTVWHYVLDLPDEHFNPHGYVERQADKTTRWEWRAQGFTPPPWARPWDGTLPGHRSR